MYFYPIHTNPIFLKYCAMHPSNIYIDNRKYQPRNNFFFRLKYVTEGGYIKGFQYRTIE